MDFYMVLQILDLVEYSMLEICNSKESNNSNYIISNYHCYNYDLFQFSSAILLYSLQSPFDIRGYLLYIYLDNVHHWSNIYTKTKANT